MGKKALDVRGDFDANSSSPNDSYTFCVLNSFLNLSQLRARFLRIGGYRLCRHRLQGARRNHQESIINLLLSGKINLCRRNLDDITVDVFPNTSRSIASLPLVRYGCLFFVTRDDRETWEDPREFEMRVLLDQYDSKAGE